jgi:tRNA-uridine 2-sulfurtransferase
MSGGVDSSVAALLLVRAGYEVVGLSMRLWSYEKEATHGCCTPEDLYDARRVADQLGISHYVSDFEAIFEEKVVDNFVESYANGETPNPCVRCNQDVKFSALMKRALELGADYLATGHYARREEKDGSFALLRARDVRRDQSYFLFGLTPQELSKVLFPLGELNKEEVRQLAKDSGLINFDKPDSQEICFVPEDYSTFVEKRLSEITSGEIVNQAGEVLARHDGIHRFTVGQRKGLGVSSLLPMYVLSVQKDGRVVVGSNEELKKSAFTTRELRWMGRTPKAGEKLMAQIRSRFEPKPAFVEGEEGGKWKIRFESPQRAITPGQAAVFYRGDELIGGGWIDSVL